MRRVDPVVIAALCATALPVAWATARAVHGGWIPVGDQALLQIRARDVLTGHHPLLGTSSSVALGADGASVELNHPGPLMFDVLALPVRAFGAGGLAVGVALVNVASAWIGCLFAHRRGGRAAIVLAALAFIGLGWAAGSEALFDPFNPIAAMMPCLAALFLVWSAIDLDEWAVPWLLGVATFCVQLNNSYLVFVVLLVVAACAVYVVRARRRGELRWRPLWVSSLVVLVVLWCQPVLEQLLHGADGNMARMWKAVGKVGDQLGLRLGSQVAAATTTLPPWWSRSRFDGIRLFSPVPSLTAALASLVATIALGAAAGRWAWRRGWAAEGAAMLTAALAAAVGWFASVVTPMSTFFGVNPDYSRWLWPASVFLFFATALVVWRLVATRIRASTSDQVLVIVAGVALSCAVVVSLPHHTSLRNERELARDRPVAKALVAQASDNLGARAVLYVPPIGYDRFGPPLLARLQADGVDFFVDDEVLVRQFGEGRRRGDRVVPLMRVLTGKEAADADGGADTVAFVTGLAADERQELADLGAAIEGWLAEGRIELSPAGRNVVDVGMAPAWYAELPGEVVDPAEVSGSLPLADAVVNRHVAADPDVMADLDRFADLRRRLEDTTAAVVLEPADLVQG